MKIFNELDPYEIILKWGKEARQFHLVPIDRQLRTKFKDCWSEPWVYSCSKAEKMAQDQKMDKLNLIWGGQYVCITKVQVRQIVLFQTVQLRKTSSLLQCSHAS